MGNIGYGQTQLNQNLKSNKEIIIFSGNAGLALTNIYIQNYKNIHVIHKRSFFITTLDAPKSLNLSVAKISDYSIGALAFGSVATMFLAYKKSKKDMFTAGLVFTESIFTTINVTNLIKSTVNRQRPYTYSANYVFNSRNDAYSFISGHSSVASCIATASWLYLPKTKTYLPIKIGLTGLAISIITMRVKAGKHFASDVISGAACGSLLTLGNYYLHKI